MAKPLGSGFYHLRCDTYSLEQTWFWEAVYESSWLCGKCRRIKPSDGVPDAHLDQSSRTLARTRAFYVLRGGGPFIANKRFCDRIDSIDSSILGNQAALGTVYDRSDRACSDWVTLRVNREIVVRGQEGADLRICDACGRNWYSSWDFPGYLTAKPQSGDLYQTWATLVVSGRVFEAAKAVGNLLFKGEELPIISPLDGLPTNVPVFAGKANSKRRQRGLGS